MGLLSRAKELGSSTSALMRGVADYRKTGTTPTRAYHLMRQYYCRTHGYSNELLSMFVKAGSAARAPAQSAGVLGNLTAEDVERVKAELDISGYYRFPTRIPEAACDRLVDFALTTPCAPVPRAAEMPERLLYQRDQPEAIAYHFDEQELFENQDVQALATDPSIIAVANAYLGSQPVLDLAAMWWSTSFGRTASSEVAQLFHFDMDRLKFLKFFIYLTDVTPENGPHVYVAKSHTRGGKPDTLWRDGRIPDADIMQAYGAEDIVQVCGPRGSIFAGDTRAFHKGTVVQTGDRLVLEVEFCNSLFGAPYKTIRLGPEARPQLLALAKSYPTSCKKFVVEQ